MSKIIMEGGTDVAEMVLFSVDELPSDSSSRDTLAALEERKQAIRLPTGADGSYLLHLYVDEVIPSGIREYCADSGALASEFHTSSGRIAFGGAESVIFESEPNPNIREDSSISSGCYSATVYRTDVPDHLVENAVEKVVGKKGARILDFPGTIIMSTVALVLLSAIVVGVVSGSLGLAFCGAVVAISGGVFWYRSYTGTDDYKRFSAQNNAVQREYPSIVILLEKLTT